MKTGKQIKLFQSTEQKDLEYRMGKNESCYQDNTFNFIYMYVCVYIYIQ